jgi:hypothetical protein
MEAAAADSTHADGDRRWEGSMLLRLLLLLLSSP